VFAVGGIGDILKSDEDFVDLAFDLSDPQENDLRTIAHEFVRGLARGLEKP
jgi:hypothetical protein